MPSSVTLDGRPDPGLQATAEQAVRAGTDIPPAIALASALSGAPLPGAGNTAARFELLATLGAADLTPARVAEPHLDALAILAEANRAGHPVDLGAIGGGPDSSWGVFAAEGPGTLLSAAPTGGRWLLSGTKPWCSLADSLSHALITAHTDAGRRLFAVGLRHPGVKVQEGTWHARGLTTVASGPVDFDQVPAVPVGPAQWYLERPGFAWGGAGVAAVWWGAAVGLGRSLHARCHRAPNQPLPAMLLGAVDSALHNTGTVLRRAAADIDTTDAATDPTVLALRVRASAHDTAETVLRLVGHALGPAPLALDDAHARRVADLTLYLRQHHAERDQAALGTRLAGSDQAPW